MKRRQRLEARDETDGRLRVGERQFMQRVGLDRGVDRAARRRRALGVRLRTHLFEVDPFAFAPVLQKVEGPREVAPDGLEHVPVWMPHLVVSHLAKRQTAIGERALLAPAMAVVVDARNQPRI